MPVTSASSIARPEAPSPSEATDERLTPASCRTLSSRCASEVYNVDRLVGDHQRAVRYPLRLPQSTAPPRPSHDTLYVHHPTAVAASQ